MVIPHLQQMNAPSCICIKNVDGKLPLCCRLIYLNKSKMNTNKLIGMVQEHGYKGCVAEAFNIFSKNLKSIFFNTWAFALAYGFSTALLFLCVTFFKLHSGSRALLLCCLIPLLLSVGSTIALYGRIFTQLTGFPLKLTCKRSAKVVVASIAYTVLLGCLLMLVSLVTDSLKPASVSMPVWALGIYACCLIVFALLSLPLFYVFTKYMAEADTRLHHIWWKSVATGFRHWGFIFSTQLLSFICVLAVSLAVSVPYMIVNIASFLSMMGTETMGDPSGLPSYFLVIEFFTVLFNNFLASFIFFFQVIVTYNMYESMEKRDKERKAFQQDNSLEAKKD